MALRLVLGSAQEYRLPRDVRPRHYDLALLYDLDPATNFSFFANVDILITADKSTKTIVLHANGLNFDHKRVKLYWEGKLLTILGVQISSNNDFFTVNLAKPLQGAMNYTLSIPFYGNLGDGLDGAYISSYRNYSTSAKEYLITTQFQPISARKAFPCFDEPDFKATYRLIIGHHQDFSVISNMPLESQFRQNTMETVWPWQAVDKTFKKLQEQFVWDHFAQSMPMSTYLVAWVVSKFDSVDKPGGAYKNPIGIWARADAKDQLEYASTISKKMLTFYVEWFWVPLPLPKLDMVAIPDFAEGAMENWGLITYREANLLYKEKETSLLFKENIVATIAHELAHQWFGNLVTMKWWSDLWLNEGFATYMGTLGIGSVEPGWDAEACHTVATMNNVLRVDVLDLSHPVSVTIKDPKTIGEIFDTISYEKGSLLVRMMIKFLGESVFKRGITKYSYGNAEQNDLWNELTFAKLQDGGFTRNISVKNIMDTWTTQAGYPLITIDRNYGENQLKITQTRYLSTISTATNQSSWWVPLKILSQNESCKSPSTLQWLAPNEGVAQEYVYGHNSGPQEWVLINDDMIAPCRVNYDEKNWLLLTQTLHSEEYTTIPVLSRVQLISDAFALAWTEVINYKLALNMVTYLRRETNYFPIETGLASLSQIEDLLKRSSDYGSFQEYVRKIIYPIYKRVGGLRHADEHTGADLKNLKTMVLVNSWACRMELPKCQEEAIKLFKQWMDSDQPDLHNPIPLEFRSIVYCQAISRGSVKEWEFLVTRWRHTHVASVAEAIVPALACTRQVWLLSKYLTWAITPGSMVRPQDAVLVLISVINSRVGYYMARSFIYNNIRTIYATFRGQEKYLGPVMQALTNQFTTDRETDEFLAWGNANQKYLDQCAMMVNQAVEEAQVNVQWVQEFKTYVIDVIKGIRY